MTVLHQADRILAAVEEGRQLVRWAEPNTAALGLREDWDAAFHRALGSPVPPEHSQGSPLLRYADGRESVHLLDAVLNPPTPGHTYFTCDVEGTRASEQNIIWIPAGASVVQLTVRNFVREWFQDTTDCGLVWF